MQYLFKRKTLYKTYFMDLLIPSFGLIFRTLLAFVIVVLILKKFAWKPRFSWRNCAANSQRRGTPSPI